MYTHFSFNPFRYCSLSYLPRCQKSCQKFWQKTRSSHFFINYFKILKIRLQHVYCITICKQLSFTCSVSILNSFWIVEKDSETDRVAHNFILIYCVNLTLLRKATILKNVLTCKKSCHSFSDTCRVTIKL